MSTKLDRQFVFNTLDSVRALANEVERLEAYCNALESELTDEQICTASAKAAQEWNSLPKIILG